MNLYNVRKPNGEKQEFVRALTVQDAIRRYTGKRGGVHVDRIEGGETYRCQLATYRSDGSVSLGRLMLCTDLGPADDEEKAR